MEREERGRNGGRSAERPGALSRRAFLKGASTVAAGGALVQEAAARAIEEGRGARRVEGEATVEFTLNGKKEHVVIEPRTTLLGALRTHLKFPQTGTKEVCDQGSCGACTVLLDDQPVCACMTLAMLVHGRSVRTVEGLARGGELSPVQSALVQEDGTMCGFCTPGFAMSMTACLEENPEASEREIREACRGNLCRCGTYPHLFRAGVRAGAEMRQSAKAVGKGSREATR